MAKKLHWTQTPEGRVKMSEIQKKAHAAIRAKHEQMRSMARDVVRKAKPHPKPMQNGHIKMQSWMQFCPYCGQTLGGKWKR